MSSGVPSWALKTSDPAPETQKKEYLPYRWKVAPGQRRPVVFAHDASQAIGIYEHEYQRMVKGKIVWGNFVTCNKTIGQRCPMCMYADAYGKYGSAQKYFLFVIDPTPYTNSKGVVVPYTRRIMAVRRAQLETLLREEQDLKDAGKGGLAWKACIVSRPNDNKSANVGTEFRPQRVVDPATFAPEIKEPPNWELLAPNTAALQAVADGLRDNSLFGGVAAVGGAAPLGGVSGGTSPGGLDLGALLSEPGEFEIEYGDTSGEAAGAPESL